MDTPRLDSERTTADLRFCHEQFESIRSDVHELAAGLQPAQIEWRPDASTWSIGECIAHLNGVTEHDIARLETLIILATAAHRAHRKPHRTHSTDAPSIRLNESPRQALVTTAGRRDSAALPDSSLIVPRFFELNENLLEVIARAATVAPVVSRNTSSAVLLDLVGHALQLNALHHWRYILQARRVMERPGFPRR